jgi:hypothetical protein
VIFHAQLGEADFDAEASIVVLGGINSSAITFERKSKLDFWCFN